MEFRRYLLQHHLRLLALLLTYVLPGSILYRPRERTSPHQKSVREVRPFRETVPAYAEYRHLRMFQ